MYSPTIGRFLQRDPIGYYDSMNLFQYAFNSPNNWIDPTGEFFTALGPLVLGIGRGLIGLLGGYAAIKAGQAAGDLAKSCPLSRAGSRNNDNGGGYYRHYTSFEGLSGIQKSGEILGSLGGTFGPGVYLTHPGIPSRFVGPRSNQTYIDVWVPNSVRRNPALWSTHRFGLENRYLGGSYPIYNGRPPILGPQGP